MQGLLVRKQTALVQGLVPIQGFPAVHIHFFRVFSHSAQTVFVSEEKELTKVAVFHLNNF